MSKSAARNSLRCTMCGGFCQATYDLESLGRSVDRPTIRRRKGGMWRFREFMPVRDDACTVSLTERGTPLLRSRRLASRLGLQHVYLKDLARNPTYSFKDYSASASVSKAQEIGVSDIVLMSAGNASSSFAAYCAVAGITFHAVMLATTSDAMLVQNLIYGPRGQIAASMAADVPSNPYRVEGG